MGLIEAFTVAWRRMIVFQAGRSSLSDIVRFPIIWWRMSIEAGRLIVFREQWRLNTLLSASGDSAYQFVFGSDPAHLSRCGERDEDLLSAQDTPLLGQFAQQWKLGIMAQEAALKKVASSNPRRLLGYNKSSTGSHKKKPTCSVTKKTPFCKSRLQERNKFREKSGDFARVSGFSQKMGFFFSWQQMGFFFDAL